jgi:anti-sigma B factor antagonist
MFHVEKRGPAVVISVAGDVDVLTSDSVRETIERAEGDAPRVVISLLECPYLDSTGLTVLVATQRRLGARLAVVVASDGNVRKIVEIASLAQFIHIVPSLEEALAAPAS